jgi:membrane-bound lytic murein transglycosylase A
MRLFSVAILFKFTQIQLHYPDHHNKGNSVRLPFFVSPRFKKHTALMAVALLTACPSHTPPSTTTSGLVGKNFNESATWQRADKSQSLQAFLKSCAVLEKQSDWQAVCLAGKQVNPNDTAAVQRYFETQFNLWPLQKAGKSVGMITGYYEPVINGSLTKTYAAQYPIRGVPRDLYTLAIPAAERGNATVRFSVNGKQLSANPAGNYVANVANFHLPNNVNVIKGRLNGNELVPYYTRAEIEAGKGDAPILAYAEDATDLFFMHIQGSGRVLLPDGRRLPFGFADKNGYPYQSIGTWLIKNGELKSHQASKQGIQNWIKQNPSRAQSTFNVNPSYIFFAQKPDENAGPFGALGVALTPEYSIAVDRHYVTLGAPVLLSTTMPSSTEPLNRLMVAQDTGSAILGVPRADFFWGLGAKADSMAGKMKQDGKMWVLLPKHLPAPKD